MEWKNVVAGQRADPEQINKIGNQVANYKGLRLARRIVLTEAVSSITFDTDDDGKPLDSKLGGELNIFTPQNTSITGAASICLRLNDVYASNYWYYGGFDATYMYIGATADLWSTTKCHINVLPTCITCDAISNYRGASSTGGSFVRGGGTTIPLSAVSKIILFPVSGTFPAGTVLEWWERG